MKKKRIVILILSVVLVNCGWLQAATPTRSDADINRLVRTKQLKVCNFGGKRVFKKEDVEESSSCVLLT